MPNHLTPVAQLVGRQPWIARAAPLIVGLDQRLRKATGDRASILFLVGIGEVVLHLRGRKTGQLRDTQLLAARHRGAWIIAGSNWGQTSPPAWAYNLRAAGPEIEVTVRHRRRTVTWRELEGDERAEAWAALLRVWPAFDEYARRAGRVIPVFALEERRRPG